MRSIRAARTAIAAGLLAGAFVTAGCVSPTRVVRVYEGRIVEGRYVSPDAYAAFLRGAIAEEAGDLKGAVTAYGIAADEDEDDPEVFARLGETRCKLDPKDGEADRAFARALKLDASYAGALAASARCAMLRGRTEEAAQLAARAAAQDPKNVGLGALMVRANAARPDPAGRERAVALTLAHGHSPVAWDALIVWGRAHRDAALIARGFEGLVRAAPARSPEIERGALALLEGGELALARGVAVAISDAPRDLGVRGPRDATVARLAVDEALTRGDVKKALARATRGHVSLAEVAARALVLDKRDIATAVAASVTEADPGSSGAAMVKAAMKGTPPSATSPHPGATPAAPAAPADQPPELCALVFADRLAAAAGAEVARAWLARITRTPMASKDPLAGPLAVALATRGVLPVADLPPELRASFQRAHAAE